MSRWILIPENILRIIAFFLPIFMMIQPQDNPCYIIGVCFYLIGMVIYFISWVMIITLNQKGMMLAPKYIQCILLLGPSYTPLIFFIGIPFMCNFLIYMFPTVLFLILHISEYVSTRKF
ncbi:MAG: hypothetical protein GF311_13835 [Candidatus Lokiarchaeota archaeon]|nr:hypothetical protein [Candidatus Lokiarchaeota archaeon]